MVYNGIAACSERDVTQRSCGAGLERANCLVQCSYYMMPDIVYMRLVLNLKEHQSCRRGGWASDACISAVRLLSNCDQHIVCLPAGISQLKKIVFNVHDGALTNLYDNRTRHNFC